MRKMMNPPAQWKESYLQVAVGEEIEMEQWLLQLVTMGYTRSQMVTSPGEYAMRGGILDIYPPYADSPIRIELFDTEVDSIRTFSADNQRSIEKLTSVRILPAIEILLDMDQRSGNCRTFGKSTRNQFEKGEKTRNSRITYTKYSARY